MAETAPSHSLGEIISRYIALLAKDPRNASLDEAQLKALAEQRAKQTLEERALNGKEAVREARRQKQAQEWSAKARSGDPDDLKAARQNAERGKYPEGMTVDAANEKLNEIRAVTSRAVPDWLNVGTLSESAEAIQLVTNITELSDFARGNPDVLYEELGKFYASIKWAEITPEVRQENRLVMNRVIRRIVELRPRDRTYSRSAILDSFDDSLEYLHLDVPENVPPVPPRPKKPDGKFYDDTSPEHIAWEKERIAQVQASKMKNLLVAYQTDLDLPENQSIYNQRDSLNNLYRKLRDGTTGGRPIHGVVDTPSDLDHQDATKQMEFVKNRLNKINAKINAENRARQGPVVTYADIKDRAWFVNLDPKYKEIISKRLDIIRNNPNLLRKFDKQVNESEVMQFSERSMPQHMVDRLLEVGYRDWFYEFSDRVFGLGSERVNPSLAQQYVYEEFRQFIDALFGSNAEIVFQEFGKHWEERSKLDYIVHSLGLGPGDTKRRLETMGMYEASDEDYLLSFDYANLAFSFYERETFGLLGDRLRTYESKLAWLKSDVDNQFYNNDKKLVKTMLQGVYPDMDPKDLDKVVGLYGKRKLHRDEYIGILKAEKLHQPEVTFAQNNYERQLEEIQLSMDTVARGVLLEDTDAWGYADFDIHLVKTTENIARLQADFDNPKSTMTPEERRSFAEDMKKLQEQKERLIKLRMGKIEEIDPKLTNETDPTKLLTELNNRRGLSHIEANVYERLREYLHSTTGKEPSQTQIRMAIWAARTHMMATGRMAAIGALYARVPGMEYKTGSWKHAMRSPAFEDLVRIMNPEMFADRFNMGGDMGEVMRAYFRFNQRKNRIAGGESKNRGTLVDYNSQYEKSFFDSDEWKHLKSEVHDNPTSAAMQSMEFAEKVLNINFSELLGPGFMSTGGQYEGNTWRMDLGVLDQIKKYYLELGTKGVLDNEALAVRYLIASPTERIPVLEKMMRRTPSKFLNLMADQRDDMLQQSGIAVNDVQWDLFQRAIQYAETSLWDKAEYKNRPVDFSLEADFNAILKPIMEKMETSDHVKLSAADIPKYRTFLKTLQDRLVARRNIEGVYESTLDAIAREKLPLTLSLDDFNWSDAQMKELGHMAFPRRTRDIGAMERARNELLSFWSNKEFILSPMDIKDTVKHLLELQSAIDDYAGKAVSEPVVKDIARLIIEFNRDRSLWSAPSFLPGGSSIGKWLAELDLRPDAPNRNKLAAAALKGMGKVAQFTVGNLAKASMKFKPLGEFMNWLMPGWKGFAHEPFEKWPHSVAEAISWSVRFTGGHGNHWNEVKIDEFISTLHDAGLFVNNPNFVHDLRAEFKAGWGIKMMAQVRRYWWVVPLATVIMASTQSIEEEKKGGHGH